MEINQLKLSGVYEIKPKILSDDRGSFTKMFHSEIFNNHNINFNLKEQYYSTSKLGVIRGMHFQLPPYDHDKFVYCISGFVQDVIVDIRKDSPTYGQHCSVILDSKISNSLFIPTGFAHGFCSLQEKSCMVYNVSTEYNSNADYGILWDSCNIEWEIERPIISERDSNFESFKNFRSPF